MTDSKDYRDGRKDGLFMAAESIRNSISTVQAVAIIERLMERFDAEDQAVESE